MRIVALVFATLFLLGTTGVGAIAALRGLRDASDIEALFGPADQQLLEGAGAASPEGKAIAELAASTKSMRAGAVAYGATAVAALLLLIVTYVNKRVGTFAIIVMGLALVGTFLSPQYDLGPLAPASARTLGYVITAIAAVGVGAAVGAASLKRRALGLGSATSQQPSHA